MSETSFSINEGYYDTETHSPKQRETYADFSSENEIINSPGSEAKQILEYLIYFSFLYFT
jgi:hypothetical protein